ncbi:MAG TPA: glycosyltransferase family 2 protein [Actinomycetes bacterium]|jgi:glycosyltransferase involved in cell wall biosynthesis|nr:glycosyltransferase family 2 protein [Actinomycetes bacterium]
MDLTRVSVVLPALNEATALPAALASFPAQADLVVTDNGSDLGSFRAIRRDALVALGIRDHGWPLEMIGRAGRVGLRVREVPVRYHARARGPAR